MESCNAVEKEVENVVKKLSTLEKNFSKTINEMILHVETLKNCADTNMENIESIKLSIQLSEIKRSQDQLQSYAADHRNLHGIVSKVGKSIDKYFLPDFPSVSKFDLFEYESYVQTMNKMILEHFRRQGMNDVSNCLLKESKMAPDTDVHFELFSNLFKIWEKMTSQKNLDLAILWAQQHSVELERRKSELLFKLHRLKFLQLLESNSSGQQAIAYARQNFQKFRNSDIKILMGTLMFLKVGIENSPYHALLDHSLLLEAADLFLKESCEILGVNKDSIFEIIISAGNKALAKLLNLKKTIVSGIWAGRNELPIEIELDQKLRNFHSIFICPILKRPSSEKNPPMRLKCGHVITKDALQKLTRGPIMKCPYCPQDSSVSEAKRICF